jgi:hypothetical protein
MHTICRGAAMLAVILALVGTSPARDRAPCVSGLKVGQRPGPYSSIVVLGEQRGQSHCFVCETGDRPAVIVFARRLSDDLGRLVAALDQAVLDQSSQELRAWVTFLAETEAGLAPQILHWGKKHAIRRTALAVFEDPAGPPSYRLGRDADVTILLSVRQKVVRNFAFRDGELTGPRIAEVLQVVQSLAVGGPAALPRP